MDPETRDYLRTWPLMLAASVLLLAGAGIYLKTGQGAAGTAALAAGLLVLGAWLATAISDWARKREE